jgi:hypothetical protein
VNLGELRPGLFLLPQPTAVRQLSTADGPMQKRAAGPSSPREGETIQRRGPARGHNEAAAGRPAGASCRHRSWLHIQPVRPVTRTRIHPRRQSRGSQTNRQRSPSTDIAIRLRRKNRATSRPSFFIVDRYFGTDFYTFDRALGFML